jgi:hypothetical protein
MYLEEEIDTMEEQELHATMGDKVANFNGKREPQSASNKRSIGFQMPS